MVTQMPKKKHIEVKPHVHQMVKELATKEQITMSDYLDKILKNEFKMTSNLEEYPLINMCNKSFSLIKTDNNGNDYFTLRVYLDDLKATSDSLVLLHGKYAEPLAKAITKAIKDKPKT